MFRVRSVVVDVTTHDSRLCGPNGRHYHDSPGRDSWVAREPPGRPARVSEEPHGWRTVVWYGTVVVRYGTVWDGTIVVRYGAVWYGTVR